MMIDKNNDILLEHELKLDEATMGVVSKIELNYNNSFALPLAVLLIILLASQLIFKSHWSITFALGSF